MGDHRINSELDAARTLASVRFAELLERLKIDGNEDLLFAWQQACDKVEQLERLRDDEHHLAHVAQQIFVRDAARRGLPSSEARRLVEVAFKDAEAFVAVENERAKKAGKPALKAAPTVRLTDPELRDYLERAIDALTEKGG